MWYYDTLTATWQSTYTNTDNQAQQLSSLIYATQSSIVVRTLQTSDATLAAQINNTLLRVDLTCNHDMHSCVEFAVGGQHPRGTHGDSTRCDCERCHHRWPWEGEWQRRQWCGK